MRDELIVGRNAVLEVLRAGRRKVAGILISRKKQDKILDEILSLAKKKNIAVEFVSKEAVELQGSIDKSQGVSARVEAYKYATIEDVISRAGSDSLGPFVLVLDGIQDPHNLGALIRTAYLMGVHGVIIPQDNSASIGPSVVKSSAGATEYILVSKVINISRALEVLKGVGIWVFGADSISATSLYNYNFSGGVAIVMGGEDRGLRPLVRRHCDVLLSIPMYNRGVAVGSYNSSVAGALFMGEVYKSRSSNDATRKSCQQVKTT